MKIIITGGGTGGHLSIAKSFKEELVKRGIAPIFIGSTYGQDRDWFENDEYFYKRYFFETSGVVNKKGLKKLSSLLNIFKKSKECKKIINDEDVKAVISVGGYSAAPASLAAIYTKTPLFIHEQNAVMGRLNKILSPFAKRVFCSFTPPYDPYPVSDIFFKKKRVRKDIKTVIFLGGSQGAKEINDFALKVANKLNEKGINIIHQTGKRDFDRVKKEYERLNIKADVFAFDKNLIEKIAIADFAVSRAGASTLWELASNALPALYLPYPYAAGNHQYYNAKYLVDKGAGFLASDLKEKDFLNILDKDMEEISKKLISLGDEKGSKKIVDEILNFIKE